MNHNNDGGHSVPYMHDQNIDGGHSSPHIHDQNNMVDIQHLACMIKICMQLAAMRMNLLHTPQFSFFSAMKFVHCSEILH